MNTSYCRWSLLFLVLFVAFSQGDATLLAGTSARGTSASPSTHTSAVVYDQPTASIDTAPVSHKEGNSGTTAFTFTVNLSRASTQTVFVDYATVNGTAVQGQDFGGQSSTLTFYAGETSKTITVSVYGDSYYEPDETFYVKLTSATNATIVDYLVTATIENDDPVPTVSIDNQTVTESDNGTTDVMFTVELSEPAGVPVVVNYSTVDGTATSVQDYVAASSTLTIPAYTMSGSITVAVKGDRMYEPQETFSVKISSPTGLFTERLGTVTIDDNDPIPTISISNPLAVSEGNSGTTTVQFVATLSNPSYEAITVSYSTVDGTAKAGIDYQTSAGTLTFAPGVTTASISVAVIGNTIFEGDKSFAVKLTSPSSNASLGTSQATETILNDDALLPTISINTVSVAETNNSFVNAVLTVTLSTASTQAVTVKFATADGTAKAGQDYTATNGTLTFASGVTSMDITVKVKGDRKTEINESFTVILSNPVNGLLGTSTGIVTIVNDDGLPKLFVGNEHMEEGNSGSKPMTFTVRLQKKASSTVTVAYATADGTALAGSDYEAKSGTLTFASGETEKTISVPITGDAFYEPEESFTVRLSNPTGATIQNGVATGTIHNDDPRPVLAINNATVDEGNSGTVSAIFTVRLSNPCSEMVKVTYATEDGSASSPSDYAAVSGTLTFNPGETSKTIAVTVNGDLVPERDEEFFVRLKKADNASLCDAIGKGVIRNDDAPSIANRCDDLIGYIRWMSSEVFRKACEKSRSDLIDGLNDVKSAFQRGSSKTAQFCVKDVLRRINETGSSGWLVQDAARQDLSRRISDLCTALDQAVSLASKDEQVFEVAEDVESPMSVDFGLAQNYPNPFNPTTTIQYALREPSMVSLKVYDMVGREVANLVETQQGAGRHTVQFNGERLTSGTYIYRIQAGSFRETKKLVLVK